MVKINPAKRVKTLVSGMSKKTIITVASLGVIAAGGSAYAIQQASTAGADEVPPIVVQVNDHENRIGSLENRADSTDQKVNQNSADIGALQQSTGTAPATVAPQPSQTSNTVTDPTTTTTDPTPEPAKDPRTITAVSDTIQSNGLRACDYTLYDPVQDAKQGVIRQNANVPCKQVGEILPY